MHKNLAEDRGYRDALLGADVAIADSGLMVMIWNLLQKDHIRRLSGLKYLRELLRVSDDIRETGQSLWIMPSIESAATNLAWLRRRGLEISFDDIYLAPMYGDCIEDEALRRKIRDRRPAHIIVAIGGATQERLGLYLKNNLSGPGHSLPRSGDCFPQRRSGPHSKLGRAPAARLRQ
jgi:N-acetylglucosaminyldiphosphoundecaprenol N-acetyl-beta-D-mannosaminyltransferase